jgi:UDP:flavonoid glycosyltransferase YjiC (YdhE family)
MPPVGYERLPLLRGDQAPVVPEARLLDIVRGVQRKRGRPEAASLSAAFRTGKRVVFGMPELDPYASFRRERIVAPPGGLPAAQEHPSGHCLFVYLGGEGATFEILAQALAGLDLKLEVYLRGEMGPIPTFLRSRGVIVHDTPPSLVEVLSRCSHVLTEGGALTSAAALASGRPQLVAPLHGEAEINLRLLQERRVAWRLEKAESSDQLREAIWQFVNDRPLVEQAVAEARRLAIRRLPDGKGVVAQSVLELLG